MNREGGLLRNMSMAPRTVLRWETRGAGLPWVGFDLRHCPAEAVTELRTGDRSRSLARLDAAWRACGLRGAFLVVRCRAGAAEQAGAAPERWSGDALLAANVLGRTRGNLLLPRFEVDFDRLDGALASDDPRLVALVHDARKVTP